MFLTRMDKTKLEQNMSLNVQNQVIKQQETIIEIIMKDK